MFVKESYYGAPSRSFLVCSLVVKVKGNCRQHLKRTELFHTTTGTTLLSWREHNLFIFFCYVHRTNQHYCTRCDKKLIQITDGFWEEGFDFWTIFGFTVERCSETLKQSVSPRRCIGVPRWWAEESERRGKNYYYSFCPLYVHWFILSSVCSLIHLEDCLKTKSKGRFLHLPGEPSSSWMNLWKNGGKSTCKEHDEEITMSHEIRTTTTAAH